MLLSAAWLGAFLTLLPWGVAADHYGERLVLALGLFASATCLVGAAFAASFGLLLALLGLTGATGASVNAASGRAFMFWFAPNERGLALGIRQTAIPAGGLVAALALPALASAGASEAAFVFLAGFLAIGAAGGMLVLRDRKDGEARKAQSVVRTLRDARLWRLSLASGLYLYAQVAVIGFGVLFLHDKHSLADHDAANVVAVAQVLAVGLRIGAGRWSDRARSRIGPTQSDRAWRHGLDRLVAGLAGGPLWLLVPAVALAGGLSMAWNGLSSPQVLSWRVRHEAASRSARADSTQVSSCSRPSCSPKPCRRVRGRSHSRSQRYSRSRARWDSGRSAVARRRAHTLRWSWSEQG